MIFHASGNHFRLLFLEHLFFLALCPKRNFMFFTFQNLQNFQNFSSF